MADLNYIEWHIHPFRADRWLEIWRPALDRALAFVAKRDGAEHAQIQLLPIGGGEARRLTNHETAADNPAWSADGRSIYFLAPDPKPTERVAGEKAKDDVYTFDESFEQRFVAAERRLKAVEARVELAEQAAARAMQVAELSAD